MATSYSIQITMSGDTANALNQGGYSMFGFKAVESALASGQPLIWFQSNNFATTVVIEWDERYSAYTSKTDIKAGVTIMASNTYPINLGQKLLVTQSIGTGSVTNGDGKAPQAIEIQNTSGQQLTCGIEQAANGEITTLCAFPLYGNGLDIIAPIEKVALFFATSANNTGAVIEQAFAPGALFDLTSTNSATVNFDINSGWSDSSVLMTEIAPDQSLAPVLITESESLKNALTAASVELQ